MGAPSAADFQFYTDKLAARLQKGLDALPNEYLGSTVADLWDLLNASSDPDLKAALGAPFLACDRQAMPGNMQTALQQLMVRGSFKAVAGAIVSQIASSVGSGQKLAAYLAGVGATTHPLAAEVFRSVVGGADPFISGSTLVSVFAPNYIAPFADHVWYGPDGTLVDKTSQAASSATADLIPFVANNDVLYVFSRYPFTGMTMGLSTLANVTIAPTFQYMNGSAYVALPGVTDGSAGFTKQDRISWPLPPDWERWNKDAGGTAFPGEKARLFGIRVARTAGTLATPPVGTCITLWGGPILQGTTKHLGVPQPTPIAVLRLTADNTVVVEATVDPDTSRFVYPPGSTLRLRAANALGADATFTFGFVDQAGANQAVAQSAWTSPAALGTKALVITGSTGIRGVHGAGCAVASTGGRGVVYVEVTEARTPAV